MLLLKFQGFHTVLVRHRRKRLFGGTYTPVPLHSSCSATLSRAVGYILIGIILQLHTYIEQQGLVVVTARSTLGFTQLDKMTRGLVRKWSRLLTP
jgi:hypothetical protein